LERNFFLERPFEFLVDEDVDGVDRGGLIWLESVKCWEELAENSSSVCGSLSSGTNISWIYSLSPNCKL